MYRDAYVDEMEQRFADYLNSKNIDEVEGAQSIIYGCSQYHIEDKARAFLEKNPSPTGRELLEFCFEAIPEDEGTATTFELEMVAQLANRLADVERTGLDDAMAFTAACEDQGLQDAAMDYVTGRESLTVQDLWHWLARMTPDE